MNSAQSTLTIWVNRHGRPCDSGGHDARPIEVVPVDRLREAEEYAAEGWAWVDEALRALGVKTVFEIPGWKGRRP